MEPIYIYIYMQWKWHQHLTRKIHIDSDTGYGQKQGEDDEKGHNWFMESYASQSNSAGGRSIETWSWESCSHLFTPPSPYTKSELKSFFREINYVSAAPLLCCHRDSWSRPPEMSYEFAYLNVQSVIILGPFSYSLKVMLRYTCKLPCATSWEVAEFSGDE